MVDSHVGERRKNNTQRKTILILSDEDVQENLHPQRCVFGKIKKPTIFWVSLH